MAISYHPLSDRSKVGTTFTAGFRVANTDDLDRISRCAVKFAWSGIVWKADRRGLCYREGNNFLFADYCLLDIDDEGRQFSLEQAKKAFCDMRHFIGVTRNHQKDKNGIVCDRYRVVIPWSKRITNAAVFEGNMRSLIFKYDSLDPQTLTAAQHFFPCTEIVQINLDGYTQDVDEKIRFVREDTSPIEYVADVAARRLHFEILGRLPPWLDDFLVRGVASPGQRHAKALGAAQELLELGLPAELIIEKIKSAPISRKYAFGEVEKAVAWAKSIVARRLDDGKGAQEAGEGDSLPRYYGDHRGQGAPFTPGFPD